MRGTRSRITTAAPGAADDFSRFLTDLTQYLNSTDYLVVFLGDSLRQGSAISTS